jgi:hypothetical protein
VRTRPELDLRPQPIVTHLLAEQPSGRFQRLANLVVGHGGSASG